MISTSYPVSKSDWRGRFVADMAEALASRANIELMVWSPPGELPSFTLNACTSEDREWLSEMQLNGGVIHLLRTRPFKGLMTAFSLLNRLRKTTKKHEFDLAHVNWLQNALPLNRQSKPMLVTVLGSDYGLLRLPGMTFLLRRVFKKNRAIIAPNAEWMREKLQKCFGDIAEIRPISFGVDPHFLKIERTPPHTPRWLIVSRITKRKMGKLLEWGESFFGPERELHLFGPMQEDIELPEWVKWHGPTNPYELAQLWFPGATGLITLSSHDEGRPQILLDAMAAGLPVIASALPAHENLIGHGTSGWIADSSQRFGEGLHALENPVLNDRMGQEARKQIVRSVGTWADCAARYEQAYRDLLDTSASNA